MGEEVVKNVSSRTDSFVTRTLVFVEGHHRNCGVSIAPMGEGGGLTLLLLVFGFMNVFWQKDLSRKVLATRRVIVSVNKKKQIFFAATSQKEMARQK